jgi:protein-disulfide isomerase
MLLRRSFALTLLLVAAAAEAQVVAVVNGQPITAAEVEERTAPSLLPLRQQEFDVRSKAAVAIAFERLQAAEAKRRGVSVEELMRIEVTDKIAPPAPERVEQMLRALRPTLSSDPAEARKQVVEALMTPAIEERQAAFQRELLAAAKYELRLAPPRVKIPVAAADPQQGRAEAPVTIVEFSDFECPYCGRSQETLRAVQKEYGERLRVIFKQFPLEEIHEHARVAAEAALCAQEQGKFWPLHDWMFANVQKLSRDEIVAAAKTLGLAEERMGQCLDQHARGKDVDADVALGQQIGVRGTPAFFVNGRLLTGALSVADFKDVIDDELRKTNK